MTYEQQARDILTRIGVTRPDPQAMSGADVCELANVLQSRASLVMACRNLLRFEWDSGDGNQYGQQFRQIPREVADAARAAIAQAETMK